MYCDILSLAQCDAPVLPGVLTGAGCRLSSVFRLTSGLAELIGNGARVYPHAVVMGNNRDIWPSRSSGEEI